MKYLNKIESAASKLDVGRSTIYELMASGELRSVKIGRSRRIPEDALQEYIKRLQSCGRSAPTTPQQGLCGGSGAQTGTTGERSGARPRRDN